MSCARYFNPALRNRILRKPGTTYPGWLDKHPRKSYIIAAVLSAPPWVDRAALNAKRDEARRLTRETGIEHVLDHIVPLSHPKVCGLTVPWNLAITTRHLNGLKGNAFSDEEQHQMEMTL